MELVSVDTVCPFSSSSVCSWKDSKNILQILFDVLYFVLIRVRKRLFLSDNLNSANILIKWSFHHRQKAVAFKRKTKIRFKNKMKVSYYNLKFEYISKFIKLVFPYDVVYASLWNRKCKIYLFNLITLPFHMHWKILVMR